MTTFHVALAFGDDYFTRREAHRAIHLERFERLRASGALIGGGPAPDGKTADLFVRLPEANQLKAAIEDDVYWRNGLWTAYTFRSFSDFVEPRELVPIVPDGSRRATIVQGAPRRSDIAQVALVSLRDADRVVLGGFFADGRMLALSRSMDPDEALGWFRETGAWGPDALTARPFIHVL